MTVNPEQIEILKIKLEEIGKLSLEHCKNGHPDFAKINQKAHESLKILQNRLSPDPHPDFPWGVCPKCRDYVCMCPENPPAYR